MHVSANDDRKRCGEPGTAFAAAAGTPLILRNPELAAQLNGDAARRRHVVVAGDCAASAAPPAFTRPSVRTMRRGAEIVRIGGRRLRLDEDSCLVVNAGGERSSCYVGESGVSPLLVIFEPRSLAQSLAAADVAFGISGPARDDFEFLETLQPRTGAVAQQLAGIERCLHDGDALALEQRIVLLLSATIAADRQMREREGTMAAVKPATRREVLRRVLMASDFIQSSYAEPVTLQHIAAAAHLSPFHLVRLFRRVHGLTPHAYLTRKRLEVALRLVSQTALGLDDIAERAGLGTRSSLFRHLRRQQGSGASALRARDPSFMEQRACTTHV